jgi:nucleoside-diphosphate-sugar epimerase
MKVLVLGKAGDIGSNVAKFLTESKEIDEVHSEYVAEKN